MEGIAARGADGATLLTCDTGIAASSPVIFNGGVLAVGNPFTINHDITLGDLIEGIVLHAFEGTQPFGRESRKKIAELKKVYNLDLTSADSHTLAERG